MHLVQATASPDGELPEHGIRTGDIVVVSEQPSGSARKREVKELEGKGVRGVVTRVQKASVSVALDGEEKGDEGMSGLGSKRMWVVKLANDVTYKRYVCPLTPSIRSGMLGRRCMEV